MYPHLIEVHHRYLGDGDKTKCTVNIDHIVCFEGSVIYTNQKENPMILVAESYDELKALIHDAGCIIAKKDPRLDDSPLTMEQLQKMIGEPVWNSNSRKWYIIHSVGNTVAMANPSEQSMLVYIKSDLSKYPLYRMKVTE